jgi:hypothetical protein
METTDQIAGLDFGKKMDPIHEVVSVQHDRNGEKSQANRVKTHGHWEGAHLFSM